MREGPGDFHFHILWERLGCLSLRLTNTTFSDLDLISRSWQNQNSSGNSQFIGKFLSNSIQLYGMVWYRWLVVCYCHFQAVHNMQFHRLFNTFCLTESWAISAFGVVHLTCVPLVFFYGCYKVIQQIMQLLDKFRWNVLKIGYIFVRSCCEETVSWGDRGEHDEGCVQLAVHSSGLGRRQTEEGHWKSNGKCLAFFSVLSQICRRDLLETFHSLFLLGIPACCRRLLFLCKWSSEKKC